MKKKYFFRKFNEAELRFRRVLKESQDLLIEDSNLIGSSSLTYSNMDVFYRNEPIEFKKPAVIPYVSGQFCISHRVSSFRLFEGSHKDYPDPVYTNELKYAIKRSCHFMKFDIATGEYDISGKIAGHVLLECFDDNLSIGNNLKLLEKQINACGYYLAKKFLRNKAGTRIYVYQFEPYKFHSGMISIPNNLYHVTNIYAFNKIKNEGFVASSKSGRFDYPPRNYFFIKRNLQLQISYMYQAQKLDFQNKGKNRIVSITIDSTLCNEVEWYTDPNFILENYEYVAIYCYEDISKDAIIGAQLLTV